MSLARPLAVLIALASLAGTPHAADTTFGDAGAVLDEETRVYLGPCVFADPPPPAPAPTPAGAPKPFAPLLIPLITAAKEVVVDFAAGALKAAGEDKSTQAIAAYPANGWMYQLDEHARLTIHPRSRCLQIVSGSFWNGLRMEPGETEASAPVRSDTSIVPLDVRERVLVDQINIAHWKRPADFPAQIGAHYRQLRQLRLFFEASLQPFPGSSDKFTLAPVALFFEKPVERGWLEWSTPKRNVLVSVTLANAGADDGKSFASVNFPFRDVPSGTLLTPLYFKEHTSRAIQVPDLTDDEKGTLADSRTLLGTATAEVTLARGTPPPAPYVAPDPYDNEGWRNATSDYCKALDDANGRQSPGNKQAVPITAPDCPYDVQRLKSSLAKARATFDKSAAMAKAVSDTNKIWTLPDNDSGVVCKPTKKTVNGAPVFSAGCQLGDTTDMRPITVSASVVEIKEGNKFAAFLGKVLEKAQPAINSAIEAAAPASQAAVAEQGKQNQGSYQLAVADVAVAQATLDAAKANLAAAKAPVDPTLSTSVFQAQRDLLAKKIAANQAARLAGLAEPYSIP